MAHRPGYIACDFPIRETLEEMRHGEIRLTAADAIDDMRRDSYSTIQYVDRDGFLHNDCTN